MRLFKKLLKCSVPEKWLTFSAATDRAAVYLTFDDGPHADYSEQILSILAEGGATATFFLNGNLVEKRPHLVQKMAEQGHRLGNHFFDHVAAGGLDYRELKAQIEKSEEAIRRAAGRDVPLIRPPYGNVSLPLFWYAVTRGKKVVLWSLDAGDGDQAESSAESIREQFARAQGGDIVLLHEDNRHTVEALPGAIADLKARGLKLKALEA